LVEKHNSKNGGRHLQAKFDPNSLLIITALCDLSETICRVTTFIIN